MRIKWNKKQNSNWIMILPAILAAAFTLVLSGCGKQAFVPGANVSTVSGAGYYEIPAKVDILLAEDDTGSMREAFDKISREFPGFLSSLESRGWDYHFAVTPLTRTRAMTEIIGSKYDCNWSINGRNSWKPPFPGADCATLRDTIPVDLFRTISNFGGFLTRDEVYSSGVEPGFETIKQTLYSRALGKSFVRSDAMLVILALSTGNDTSGVVFEDRGDGFYKPTPESLESSFQAYRTHFSNLVVNGRTQDFRFYSAVGADSYGDGGTSCQSYGRVRSGSRYTRMSNTFSGKSTDVCQSNSIRKILDHLDQDLSSVRVNTITRYITLSEQPRVESIKLTLIRDGQEIEIPRSPTNGWNYMEVDQAHAVYAIEYPIQNNLVWGHLIQLNGNYKLVGNDKIRRSYESASTGRSIEE